MSEQSPPADEPMSFNEAVVAIRALQQRVQFLEDRTPFEHSIPRPIRFGPRDGSGEYGQPQDCVVSDQERDDLKKRVAALEKENTELRWDGALNEAHAKIKALEKELARQSGLNPGF